ncbi:MAG: hypothetical protein WC454_03415 [Phycisphaerae bacterium]|jgi:hypothetical protein
MKNTTIVVLKNMTQELLERDYSGKIIQQENALSFGLKMPISFKIDNDKLNSLLIVWVPKKNLPLNHYREFTTSFTIEHFPQYIQKINYLKAFEAIVYRPVLRGKHKMNKYEKTIPEEVDAVITDELFDQLVKQKEEDRLSRDAFKSATKILYSFACNATVYGFESHANDIRQLLNYLEDCIANSECLFETSWYHEKLSLLRSSFEELIKRKMVNNPNYEYYLKNVKDIAYLLGPPHSWRGEPPNPYVIEEIIKNYSRTS